VNGTELNYIAKSETGPFQSPAPLLPTAGLLLPKSNPIFQKAAPPSGKAVPPLRKADSFFEKASPVWIQN